jgi:hypothetical protein
VQEETWEVGTGSLMEGPEWELVAGLRVRSKEVTCPHVVVVAGERRLPRGVKGYAESGYAAVVLCYDCIQGAVRAQGLSWGREA